MYLFVVCVACSRMFVIFFMNITCVCSPYVVSLCDFAYYVVG